MNETPFPNTIYSICCLSIGSEEKSRGKNDFKVLDGRIEALVTEDCAGLCVCVCVCVCERERERERERGESVVGFVKFEMPIRNPTEM